jgi:hypothetical protein
LKNNEGASVAKARSQRKKSVKLRPAHAGRPSTDSRRGRILREHLVRLLSEEQAHAGFDSAVANFPAALRGRKIAGSPHTAWQLLEHLRIAQWDILEFSRNPRHVSPSFPEGYWPPTEAPLNAAAWMKTVRAFRTDLRAMMALVRNPRNDLFAPIPGGRGQTLLREAMLVADHNAYHLGQLLLLRRMVGA